MNIIICSFPWKLWEIFWRSQIIIILQILRQTLFYNDALMVPVWISIFCKPFINFQQVFFERPPAEIERPCPVARVHMVARLFIDRFSINQVKTLVWVKRKEHMCQNMTRASSKKTMSSRCQDKNTSRDSSGVRIYFNVGSGMFWSFSAINIAYQTGLF